MKLIGEAGGTKVDWRVLDGDEIATASTRGFNATLVEQVSFLTELEGIIQDASKVTSIHFYAAGIRTDDDKRRVANYFRRDFPSATVEVSSDTLAAARGLLGTEGGWVGFIGTGSGLAQYDGREIIHQVPSLGYILGDEGSATYFGKELLRQYMRGQLQPRLQRAIENKLKEAGDPVKNTYQNPQPQRFLGSIAAALDPEADDDEIREIVRSGFQAYFDAYLPSGVERLKVSFTGSVAYVHKAMLREVGHDLGIDVDKVVASPIDGLIRYHSQVP